MVIETTPCSLNDNTLVQFIYALALTNHAALTDEEKQS